MTGSVHPLQVSYRGEPPGGEPVFGFLTVKMKLASVCDVAEVLQHEETGFDVPCEPGIQLAQFCELLEAAGGWVVCYSAVLSDPLRIETNVVFDKNTAAGQLVADYAQLLSHWITLHNDWSQQAYGGGLFGNAKTRRFLRNNPRPPSIPQLPSRGKLLAACQFCSLSNDYEVGPRISKALSAARLVRRGQVRL